MVNVLLPVLAMQVTPIEIVVSNNAQKAAVDMAPCDGNGTCVCDVGFSGKACDFINCPKDCKNKERYCMDIVSTNCFCAQGWGDADCQTPVCQPSATCSGNGICGPEKKGSLKVACKCDRGWDGPACNTRYVVPGHGLVLDDGTVKCFKYTWVLIVKTRNVH